MNNEATSVHDERPADKSKPASGKIILAIVLVGLMIVSGLVIVAPGAVPAKNGAKEPLKADVQALGPRKSVV